MIIGVLALTGLAVVSEIYVSIPLFSTIRRAFEVSQTQTALLGTAFGLAYAGGFLVFGPLSDHYSRKRVIVVGLLVLAFATFAVGISTSFVLLLSLRALQGFAASTFGAAALAYLSEVLSEDLRPVGIAFMTTSFLLAAILGQIYANIINIAFGWEWVFWSLAGIYVALFALMWQLPEGPSDSSSTSVSQAYVDMGKLLRKPALVSAYLVALVPLFVLVAMYTGLGSYLPATYGVTQQQLLLVRLAGVPGILLSPLAGRLITRWGSTWVVVGGLAFAATGLVIEGFAVSLAVLVVGSVVFITGIGAVLPALVSLIGGLAGSAQGAAMALYGFVLFVGASLGPLVVPLFQSVGLAGLYAALTIVLLIAAGFLALVSAENTLWSSPSTDLTDD